MSGNSASKNPSAARRRAAQRPEVTLRKIRKLWRWTFPIAVLSLLLGVASGVVAVHWSRHAIEPIVKINGSVIDREMFRRRLDHVAAKRSILNIMIEDELAL